MTGFIDGLLNISPLVAYIAVFCLVFAEDAFFIGFVIPGETAAVLGGVVASRGEVQLGIMMVLVVGAAIVATASAMRWASIWARAS
jgi:membrane protein DedA with SNARE-associated domain